MATFPETERYIQFLLEQLAGRNEHHVFEQIVFQIALRRLSSNIVPATGPVSAGGDQGRDAESYYTNLPHELPGADGFVGRATTEPWVLAASVQKPPLDGKIRDDLKSICSRGEPVRRVAFFAVHEIPVAARHRLQQHARDTYDVALDVFDGQAVAGMLTQGDLVWIAQRFLDLPSAMIPDEPAEAHPDWYRSTLTALRERPGKRLTPGALSEVRDGLRHATFDDEARVDLPEWLGYVGEFIDAGNGELALRARYERVLAVLRGKNSLEGVEADIRAVIDAALSSERVALLDDAGQLLLYWGGAWLRHLGTANAEELRELDLRLRQRVAVLIEATDSAVYPVRKASLLDVAARLCLHPRWPQVTRPAAGALPTPQETTRLRRAGEIVPTVSSANPLVDATEAMNCLEQLVDLLPQAPAFPVGGVSETFQIFAPALTEDPRYEKIRDALDAAQADLAGDSSVAARCRDRAMAFLRAGRPLDALHELHEVKINWWHGDTLRGALLTMRMIGKIYGDLDLQQAARQYAVTAAAVAASPAGQEHQDLLPAALTQAMAHTHAAGHWGDALALGGLAFIAHQLFAETPEDYPSHGYIQQLDFHASMVMLSAERFRPALMPVLRELTDADYLADLDEHLPLIRPSFTQTEQQFIQNADDQLTGRPFSDVGAHRDMNFAALGTTWRIRCDNTRATVLAAERFTAAVQISLAELAPHDPLFLPQDILVRVITGTPLGGGDRVTFRPNNHAIDCTVILSPYSASTDHTAFERELSTTVVHLLAHLSARPTEAFMSLVKTTFARGLLHKLISGRPYDEAAGLLAEAHYDTLRQSAMPPWSDTAFQPPTAPQLAQPTTPGPGYDRTRALDMIRDNYTDLPQVLSETLPRVLADCGIRTGLEELRNEGWLDWQILLALANIAANLRLQQASPGSIPRDYPTRFFRTPESHYATALPLNAFTADSLRAHMDVTLLAIAQRRWKLGSAMTTPNPQAFKELLTTRYNYATDDVPHCDLLNGSPDEHEPLLPPSS
ncbi:hypothetical protein [Streptomyces pratensis]|uniref:hypothetical protein n=1 Tax=Streptomyces pratensis TaxID=1169025 RepID=UPI00193477A3|nr:hypothetical protein [Streptomyces pratensis]